MEKSEVVTSGQQIERESLLWVLSHCSKKKQYCGEASAAWLMGNIQAPHNVLINGINLKKTSQFKTQCKDDVIISDN